MPHGRKIDSAVARECVKVHRNGGFKKSKVDGHQFDLNLIKSFLSEIDAHNSSFTGMDAIDSIRIYYGKSKRGTLKKADRDLIIVPVKADGKDLYTVYAPKSLVESPGIIGFSNPCPNVCEDKKFIFCEDAVKKPARKRKPKKRKK
jgi:hypothetical protein